MKLFINDFQIIKSDVTPDYEPLKTFIACNINPEEKFTKRKIKNFFSYNSALETSFGIIYSFRGNFYNQDMELIGVKGKLNPLVIEFLKINGHHSGYSACYFNKNRICPKLLKALEKYSEYSINLLDEITFKTLCFSPVKISTLTPSETLEVITNYLYSTLQDKNYEVEDIIEELINVNNLKNSDHAETIPIVNSTALTEDFPF